MAYRLYLFGKEMPVNPAKTTLKVKNKNTTLDLLDGTTINILKSPGLSEISLSLCFPMLSASRKPDYYLGLLEKYKGKKKTTQFILTRTTPDDQPLFDTNIKVSVEDYTINEEAKRGFDFYVDVSLKQYKDYGTQTVTVKTVTENGQKQKVATTTKERETTNAPTASNYTIKQGDTLWAIAAKYLGSGARFKDIVEANKDKVSDPNLVPVGTVLRIPAR